MLVRIRISIELDLRTTNYVINTRIVREKYNIDIMFGN